MKNGGVYIRNNFQQTANLLDDYVLGLVDFQIDNKRDHIESYGTIKSLLIRNYFPFL